MANTVTTKTGCCRGKSYWCNLWDKWLTLPLLRLGAM